MTVLFYKSTYRNSVRRIRWGGTIWPSGRVEVGFVYHLDGLGFELTIKRTVDRRLVI
jgi:hypothetical protein